MEWETIANKLLEQKLYLTALELYYELLETNHEINPLRDFFSNPGNFESFYNIPRSTSLQTFDSLDLLSRYSDDEVNVSDERITVLEFELRKAQETINALRGSLTNTAAQEHKERDYRKEETENILPYEKRSLNFLIGEYLLRNDYKLTAITFSEETSDQDIDDWEDVGINCPRPPPLLGIYRNSNHHVIDELQLEKNQLGERCKELMSSLATSQTKLERLQKLVAEYEEQAKSTSSSNCDLVIVKSQGERKRASCDGNLYGDRNRRQISDCSAITQDSIPQDRGTALIDSESAVESMTSVTTSNEDIPKVSDVERKLAEAFRESPQPSGGSLIAESDCGIVAVDSEEEDDLEAGEANSEKTSDDCVQKIQNLNKDIENSDTGDNIANDGDGDSSTSSANIDAALPPERDTNDVDDNTELTEDDERILTDVDGIDDDRTDEDVREELSKSDVNKSEDDMLTPQDTLIEDKLLLMHSSGSGRDVNKDLAVSKDLASCTRVLVSGSVESRLGDELALITDDPILVMGRTLPHILPHVLLNKREELLPIILCLSLQHPDAKERDNLLHLLFNLVRRPDYNQRQIIKRGCEAFAANVDRMRLEEELLPQCWEQITDKHVERRLLVSESCGTLAPYLSKEVCSSLLLSILKQTLDDKDESVRESAIRNVTLVVTQITNSDKVTDLKHILNNVLLDVSSKVQASTLSVYLPVFSAWCIHQNMYLNQCYNELLQQLLSAINTQNTRATSAYLDALISSIPFVLCSFIKPIIEEDDTEYHDGNTKGSTSESCSNSSIKDVETCNESDLSDPCIILSLTQRQLRSYVSHFNTRLSQDTLSEILGSHVTWFKSTAVPCLIECINQLQDKAMVTEFSKLLNSFNTSLGRPFLLKVLKPVFEEQAGDSKILPIYCAGILALNEDDRSELRDFLYKTLNEFAAQFKDIDCLTETFSELSQNRGVLHIIKDVLSTTLKEATNSHVKGVIAKICKGLCDCGEPQDIVSHILPILSHIANDPDVFVQTSTVLAFAVMLQRCTGSLTQIRDQLDRFINTAVNTDVHVMMCELIESFTLVLPLCSPNIQREFLIPRLATLGVSNSSIQNKTKKRDITERLINAYKAVLCSYITGDTIEHYVIPGLQALSTDCQELLPDKQGTVDVMLREVISKTNLAKETRSSTAFGSKVSGFFKKK